MTLRPALHTAMASIQASFAQLLEYVQREEEVLKDLGAPDLKACLRTGAGTKGHTENPERMKFYKILSKILNTTEDLSQEQRQQLADWEARICSPKESEQSVQTAFAEFTNILQRRKSDLQNLGKTSLKACFMTNKSKKDKDLKFGQNFFSRKASSLNEAQRQELAKWEAEICGDGVPSRPAVDKEYTRLLEILESRKTDLQNLGKTSLKACFVTSQSNEDKDIKFGRNFFSRKASSLNEAQRQELAKWEAEICGDGVPSRPAVDKEYTRLLEILESRKTDLQKLGKTSLEDCFMTNQSNQDKELQFARNFFRRKASSLSDEQKEELAKWEAEIRGDGLALRPAVDKEFNRLLEILESRKTDLQKLGKTSLDACFMTNKSNQDKELQFLRHFLETKCLETKQC